MEMPEDTKQKILDMFAKTGFSGDMVTKWADVLLDMLPDLKLKEEHDALVSKLHKTERHPDYEYTYTESQRKGEGREAEGYGWLPNNFKFDGRNWERDDFTDTEYWYRTKADALKDPVSPFELAPVVHEKLTLSAYIDILNQTLPKHILPTSSLDLRNHTGLFADIQSKETLLHRLFHDDLKEGLYHIAEPYDATILDRTPDFPELIPRVGSKWIKMAQYHHSAPLEILTSLDNPAGTVFVRTMNKAKAWSQWYRWLPYQSISFTSDSLLSSFQNHITLLTQP